MKIDLQGNKFGRLTAIKYVGGPLCKWECLCDCGTVVQVQGRHLRDGHTRSCGCLLREKADEETRKQRDSVSNWSSHLRIHYSTSYDEYYSLLEKQGGACAVCGVVPVNRRLSVDHNHDTGRVRGLLCLNCNAAIGNAKESAELLRKLADYVDVNSRG